jgi:hypothetical protein
MKDNFLKEKCMDREYYISIMETYMKESFKIIKLQVLAVKKLKMIVQYILAPLKKEILIKE